MFSDEMIVWFIFQWDILVKKRQIRNQSIGKNKIVEKRFAEMNFDLIWLSIDWILLLFSFQMNLIFDTKNYKKNSFEMFSSILFNSRDFSHEMKILVEWILNQNDPLKFWLNIRKIIHDKIVFRRRLLNFILLMKMIHWNSDWVLRNNCR